MPEQDDKNVDAARVWAVLKDARLVMEHARVVFDADSVKKTIDPNKEAKDSVTLQVDTEGKMTFSASFSKSKSSLNFRFGWKGQVIARNTRQPVIEYENEWRALLEVTAMSGELQKVGELEPLWPYLSMLSEMAMRRVEQTLSEMGIAQKLNRPDVRTMKADKEPGKPSVEQTPSKRPKKAQVSRKSK